MMRERVYHNLTKQVVSFHRRAKFKLFPDAAHAGVFAHSHLPSMLTGRLILVTRAVGWLAIGFVGKPLQFAEDEVVVLLQDIAILFLLLLKRLRQLAFPAR